MGYADHENRIQRRVLAVSQGRKAHLRACVRMRVRMRAWVGGQVDAWAGLTYTVSQRRLSQMRRKRGRAKRSAATSRCWAMAASKLVPSRSCGNKALLNGVLWVKSRSIHTGAK